MSKKKSCYKNATGEITYNFTNDYMFRAILQRKKTVLKGIICSLLHLDPDSVVSITINNPIELGKSIDNKEFVLDINFSDKFTLSVIDLTHIDEATEEYRFYQIDRWAKLFKATTWKELKNLTKAKELIIAESQKEIAELKKQLCQLQG